MKLLQTIVVAGITITGIVPKLHAQKPVRKPTVASSSQPKVPPQVFMSPLCEGQEIIRGRILNAPAGVHTQVRAIIYNASGVVTDQSGGLIEPDFAYAIPLHSTVAPKSIVVVHLLKGDAIAASTNPVLVCSADTGRAVPTTSTAETTRSVSETRSASETRSVSEKDTKKALHSCEASPADDVFAPPRVGDITTGQEKIKGSAPFHSGTVELCVNGEPRELSDPSAKGNLVPFANDRFELTPKSPLKANEKVRVIVIGESKRLTVDKTVTDPCAAGVSSIADGAPDVGTLRAGGKTITGKTSLTAGTLSVCVNGEPVKVGDAEDSVAYTDGKFTTSLIQPTKLGDTVRIILVDKDATKRLSRDVTVESSCSAQPVSFRILPREGDNTIYGVGSKSTTTSKCMVAVFLNGDGTQLVTDDAGLAWSIPTDDKGSFAARLRTSIDAGQCVTLLQLGEGENPDRKIVGQNLCTSEKGGKVTRHSATAMTRLAPQTVGASGFAPGTTEGPLNIVSQSTQSFLNFGRVRSYFAAGSVLSTEGQNFVRPDLFLAFNMTKNYIWGGPTGTLRMESTRHGVVRRYVNDTTAGEQDVKSGYQRIMLDGFFEARLTAIPAVVVCTQADGACTKSDAPTPPRSNLDTFLASRRAATFQTGMVAPIVLTTWTHATRPHALSLGPIAKIGFQTPIDTVDQNGNRIDNLSQKSFYIWHGYGGRLGFHEMSTDRNVAPDLISYIDFVMGRFSNMDSDPLRIIHAGPGVKGCVGDERPGLTTNMDCMYERYARPWRLGIEGLFKIPTTSWVFGFSANIRQNLGLSDSRTVDHTRDDLRFFIGTKFNIGTILGKLKQLDDQLPKAAAK